MKNPLDYIESSPHLFTTFMGISHSHFQSLVKEVEQAQLAEQEALESKKHRVNAKGAGRPPKLNLSERLALCLFYLRHNPIFEVLALMFDVSCSEAHHTFHENLKWICQLLPASLFKQFGDDPELWALNQEILKDEILIVDSTEQSLQRPSEQGIQKEFFSGKKKQHTLKSSLIVTSDGLEIVDVILGVPGPKADVTLFREQQDNLDSEQDFLGDKAYVGADRTTTPIKKPKKRELTDSQKDENREISKQRIFVEHLIRRLKIFRILSDRYRLRRTSYRAVIAGVCGLVRLRLGRIDFRI